MSRTMNDKRKASVMKLTERFRSDAYIAGRAATRLVRLAEGA